MFVKDLSQTKFGITNKVRVTRNQEWITPQTPDRFYSAYYYSHPPANERISNIKQQL